MMEDSWKKANWKQSARVRTSGETRLVKVMKGHERCTVGMHSLQPPIGRCDKKMKKKKKNDIFPTTTTFPHKLYIRIVYSIGKRGKQKMLTYI